MMRFTLHADMALDLPHRLDPRSERALADRFGGALAGIDEAGRGPWAGPVACAAVILDYDNLPSGLADSKALKPAERERLHDEILDSAEVALAFAAVLPWHWRSYFPVNSFSANYVKVGRNSTQLTRLLYRIKKWQYVFYKHCLLHGLNASVAIASSGGEPLVNRRYFRLYWLCLNTAYVMEFFLQTLVKRRYLSQSAMLALQQLLMAVSTVAAVQVLAAVSPILCLLSFALNMLRRQRDVSNGAMVLAAALAIWHIWR